MDPSAQLGPNVVVGPDCVIEAGVKIRNATIHAGTTIKGYTLITDSIIGWKNKISSWARITDMTVTAEDVTISDESNSLVLSGTQR